MATEPAVVTNERRREVRERQFPPDEFQRVMLLIHESRVTGTLMLDLQQGGIRNIRLHEERAIRIGDVK
jgi:hypothetical protein